MNQADLHTYNIGSRVRAFSTTRAGGVSQGQYATFNINAFCGDEESAIAQNRERLAEELGVDASRLIIPHQVHGVECRHIAQEFFDMPDGVRTMLLDGVDAVTTCLPGVCIGVSTADCIPVLLYDEAHHAVAAIHAGWRGTVERIVMKTVMDMRMQFGTQPKELKAIIGPGISVKNFEVGQEVYDAFEKAAFNMKEIAERHEKWHINLPLCNCNQLLQCGMEKENVQMADICTFDNNEKFFSARRQGIQSGRIYTGIMLTD